MRQTCFLGDIGEGAVTVVVKQIAGRVLIPLRWLQARSVYKENIEPAVIVVVEQRYPTAHLFQQELFVGYVSRSVFGMQKAGSCGYIREHN
jgi:hypothetical protein